MRTIKISIIIPAYNEENCIKQIIEKTCRLRSYFNALEIVVVNDGSTDNTAAIVKELSKKLKIVKLLNLEVNSGHMAALTAGLKFADGDWIGTIDADGQDDPNLFIKMYEQCLKLNADICFTRRINRRKDSYFHRIFSPAFYKLMSLASRGNVIYQSADFRLISKRVQKTLNALPEVNRMYRVLIPSLGYRSTVIDYERNVRSAGVSKYNIKSLIKLSSNSFLATTGSPLRWVSIISIISAFFSLLVSGFSLIQGFLENSPPGWASLAFIVSLMFFLQSISTLVVTEFLFVLLGDVRQRPTYQVKN